MCAKRASENSWWNVRCSTRSVQHTRNIVLTVCLAVLACSASYPTKPTSEGDGLATEAKTANPPTYLALGDSIGFPKYVQQLTDIRHTNAACNGETTSSFLEPNAPDRGCRASKQKGYTGTQMDLMTDYIRTHAHLRLVTLELGANDALLALEQCNYDAQCVSSTLPGTFQTMANNLTTIFATIRGLGYAGQIVVPLYYDPFPKVAPDSSRVLAVVNAILGKVGTAFGAQVVDVNASFVAASAAYDGDPRAAGLLIPLTGWNSWVTTAAGARLIADDVARVVRAH